MRILVCGGREFDDWALFSDSMWGLFKDKGLDNQDYFEGDSPPKKITIIHGNAIGADFCARLFAKLWGLEEVRCSADWKTHGRAAGVIRNQQMLDEENPDLVVAFPGGVGTADMIKRSKKAGVVVVEVKDR